MKSLVVWRRKNAREYRSAIGTIKWSQGWKFYPSIGKDECPNWFPALAIAKREAEKGWGPWDGD